MSVATKMDHFSMIYTTEEAFRHTYFQVASIITTTGYTTTDFNMWPIFAKVILLVLMLTGAMAGSTAGGIKTSRIVILFKGFVINIRKIINPNYVPNTKYEGKPLDSKLFSDVFGYISLYFVILIGVTLLLCIDPVNGSVIVITSDAGTYSVTHDFFTNFSATISSLSNIGPAFEAVGPYSSFANYNEFSKILLTLTMLVGRLEIYPILILFFPKTYKNI
jgi:trk system potassium uptake protein TrkH